MKFELIWIENVKRHCWNGLSPLVTRARPDRGFPGPWGHSVQCLKQWRHPWGRGGGERLIDGVGRRGWSQRRRERWRRLRQKVTSDEGVDVDELRARAVLLEVVAGLEVHGRQWGRQMKTVAENTAFPDGVAVDLGSCSTVNGEDVEAQLCRHLDGDGRRWWWLMMASGPKAKQAQHRRGEMVEGLLCQPMRDG
jgi:hypothetical protein